LERLPNETLQQTALHAQYQRGGCRCMVPRRDGSPWRVQTAPALHRRRAAARGDDKRAALLVTLGVLTDEGNLRPALDQSPAEVAADYEHFRSIAVRARTLVGQLGSAACRRDVSLFGFAGP